MLPMAVFVSIFDNSCCKRYVSFFSALMLELTLSNMTTINVHVGRSPESSVVKVNHSDIDSISASDRPR